MTPIVTQTERRVALRGLAYAWSAPNTLLAMSIGLVCAGKFRVISGVVEIHGPAIAFLLERLPNPARAMTVGHVVFGRTAQDLVITRRHEWVHVRQYERWGPAFIPIYLGASLWLAILGRDAYRENFLEIEAYAVDDPSKRATRNSVSDSPPEP